MFFRKEPAYDRKLVASNEGKPIDMLWRCDPDLESGLDESAGLDAKQLDESGCDKSEMFAVVR